MSVKWAAVEMRARAMSRQYRRTEIERLADGFGIEREGMELLVLCRAVVLSYCHRQGVTVR